MTKYEDIKYVPFDEEPSSKKEKEKDFDIEDESLIKNDNDDIIPNTEFYEK